MKMTPRAVVLLSEVGQILTPPLRSDATRRRGGS